MTRTTHQMWAILLGLLCLLHWPTVAGPIVGSLSLLALMIGGVLPDIDQPTANIWHRYLGGSAVGNIFQFFSGGHRHITHSLVGLVLIGWGLAWLVAYLLQASVAAHAWLLWQALMIGYVSHLLADTITDHGVPWLWPLHLMIKIPPGPPQVRVTTDSWVERIVVRGGLIVAAALVLSRGWPIVAHYFTQYT